MASKSSKSIPFLVLAIVVFTMIAEVHYGVNIDLEQALPVLLALGVSGAGLSAVKSASHARKSLPADFEKIIKEEIKKGLDSIPKS